MKFAVGTIPGMSEPHVFAVQGDTAVDLTSANPDLGSDLAGVIEAWNADPAALRALVGKGKQVPYADLTLAMPLAKPGKIICLGLNYAEHAKEGGYDIPDYPAMFLRVNSSVMAANAPMVIPNASITFDYEAELMVVIGKGGRHISEDNALDHVFGYTAFNDGSVREYQRKTHQWTAGKNFDQTGAIGPVVVTQDEVPTGARDLKIMTRLNGETVQNSNTSDMIFPVEKTVAILSEIMTLEAGDLIAFGTPPGVGHARRPQLWMKPGDTVEVEIEGIGICQSPLVSEDAALQAAAE